MNGIATDAQRRHDFVMLFDVTDGNPNGDPDAGNLPRVDPETMQGLVTDVSLKRRVRNWVDATKGNETGYRIYVQNKGIALNELHQEAYDAEGLKSTGSKQTRDAIDRTRAWMCRNFYDIRTFGAVMTTGVNCGQVRGPVQLTFARSVDPLVPLEMAITRVAVTKPEDARVVVGEDGQETSGKQTEMGRKTLVPYGLYRGYGFFTPSFAAQTSFDGDDLSLFWTALLQMWDLDRSSSRGLTALKALNVFSHDNPLGNARADELFSRVTVRRAEDVTSPRSFADYTVHVETGGLPQGVTHTALV